MPLNFPCFDLFSPSAAIAVPLALNNDAQRLPVRVRKEIADEWDFDGGSKWRA